MPPATPEVNLKSVYTIEWEGKSYRYEPDALDIKAAYVIKAHTGLGIMSWMRSAMDGDPASIQALVWAIKSQNGETCVVNDVNVPVMAFLATFVEALTDDDDEPDPTPAATPAAPSPDPIPESTPTSGDSAPSTSSV